MRHQYPLFQSAVSSNRSIERTDSTRYTKALEKHAPKLPPPELRLYPGALGGIVFAIAFFWFGWTSYPSISYWSPLIATSLIGIGILFVFLSLFNYIIDTYLWSAGSALAANTIVR